MIEKYRRINDLVLDLQKPLTNHRNCTKVL